MKIINVLFCTIFVMGCVFKVEARLGSYIHGTFKKPSKSYEQIISYSAPFKGQNTQLGILGKMGNYFAFNCSQWFPIVFQTQMFAHMLTKDVRRGPVSYEEVDGMKSMAARLEKAHRTDELISLVVGFYNESSVLGRKITLEKSILKKLKPEFYRKDLLSHDPFRTRPKTSRYE
jgi:hypothetical protein